MGNNEYESSVPSNKQNQIHKLQREVKSEQLLGGILLPFQNLLSYIYQSNFLKMQYLYPHFLSIIYTKKQGVYVFINFSLVHDKKPFALRRPQKRPSRRANKSTIFKLCFETAQKTRLLSTNGVKIKILSCTEQFFFYFLSNISITGWFHCLGCSKFDKCPASEIVTNLLFFAS